MNEPKDCENCHQSYWLHIEVKDMNGDTHRLCPTSVYKEIDETKYMTKKERLEYEKTKQD